MYSYEITLEIKIKISPTFYITVSSWLSYLQFCSGLFHAGDAAFVGRHVEKTSRGNRPWMLHRLLHIQKPPISFQNVGNFLDF